MAVINGTGGSVTIPGIGTIHFSNWSINYRQAATDTTSFGDSARTKIPGIREFSGSARGFLDGSTAPSLPTSVVTTATFTAAPSRTWVGSIVVTELNPEVTIDGDATVTLSFEGTGDLTLA